MLTCIIRCQVVAAHREPEGSLLAAASCCFGSAMPNIVLNIFDEVRLVSGQCKIVFVRVDPREF